ncbi:MAG: Clp protease N-terminal domain-containing protein, partial [Alphaproteobacteria bacterium]|nr:Clp protease N-terminal domain-containing protein [Alphaproteobacteria bacterium]
MEFEKFTDRAKGFIQSAQGLALRGNHQQFTPEHLLKILFEDKEGLAAGLIRAAEGDPAAVIAGVTAALEKLPKVKG